MIKTLLMAASLVAFTSCSDDEATTGEPVAPGSNANGISAPATPLGQNGQQANQQDDGLGLTSDGFAGGMAGDVMNPTNQQVGDNLQANVPGMPGQGTIEGENIAPGKANQQKAANSKGLRYVKVHSLYVRSGPGMSFKPVGYVPFNKPLAIQKVANKGAWAQIGVNRWVGTRYLSDAPNKQITLPAKFAH